MTASVARACSFPSGGVRELDQGPKALTWPSDSWVLKATEHRRSMLERQQKQNPRKRQLQDSLWAGTDMLSLMVYPVLAINDVLIQSHLIAASKQHPCCPPGQRCSHSYVCCILKRWRRAVVVALGPDTLSNTHRMTPLYHRGFVSLCCVA